MAVGELTAEEKERVNAAVAAAEEKTGLEFCVIVGSNPQNDARHEAERVFHKLGMHERPAIMVMVVPHARTIEIVTAHGLSERITDIDSVESVTVMTEWFTSGAIASGLEHGIAFLADRAGPRQDGQHGHVNGVDLPNVVDLDED